MQGEKKTCKTARNSIFILEIIFDEKIKTFRRKEGI